LIGEKLGAKYQAQSYVKAQQDKINNIQDCLSKAPVKTITLLEWFDPIYNCGHWIPDQIEYAKGRDLLSNPHGNSYRVNINELIINDPEYILIAPCGFTIERTLQEIQVLTEHPLWSSLQAVKNQQVYVLPYEYFTQSSLSTLVHGIEILAAILHPTFYEPSVALKNKIHRLIH
jgi:iron complex transport system substrate-binding protein